MSYADTRSPHLPLPLYTSSWHMLPVGSHEPHWSTVRPWFCLQNVSKREGTPGNRWDCRSLPCGLEVPGFTHDSAKGVCRRRFRVPLVHEFKFCLPEH